MQGLLPRAEIEYAGSGDPDPRSYQVSFALFKELLPHFEFEYTLESGMAELHDRMQKHGFSARDFEGSQFVRLRTLQESGWLRTLRPAV